MKKITLACVLISLLSLLSGCFDTGREIRDESSVENTMQPATGDVSVQ